MAGAFGEIYDGDIGDFPTEAFHLLLMLKMLFEKYGFAGVGGEGSGDRHKDFTGSVVNLDTTSEQG